MEDLQKDCSFEEEIEGLAMYIAVIERAKILDEKSTEVRLGEWSV